MSKPAILLILSRITIESSRVKLTFLMILRRQDHNRNHGKWCQATTCASLKYLPDITICSARLKAELPVREVPEKEQWRVGLLTSLSKVKEEEYSDVKGTKHIYVPCATPAVGLSFLFTGWPKHPHYLGASTQEQRFLWRNIILLYFTLELCSNKSL